MARMLLLLCGALALEPASALLLRRASATADSLLQDLAADLNRIRGSMRRLEAASLVQLESAPADTKEQKKHKHLEPADALKIMNGLGGGAKAQMPAMVGLLKGMYDTWKDKIGEANKREQEQKKEFDEQISGLEAKKAKFKNDANATKTYDTIEKYWKKQREISHRQYHTALKIMHAGMMKFKAVEGAMSDAVAGKKPTAKDLRVIGMVQPEVVLLQRQARSLSSWAEQSAEEIRNMQASSGAPEAPPAPQAPLPTQGKKPEAAPAGKR